jgi:hypothetical protein
MVAKAKSLFVSIAAHFAALSPAGDRRIEPSRVVLVVLGLILLTAAALKSHQLATEPVLGTGILNSRWLLIIGVEVELFFGLWLVSGVLPRLSWAMTLACFGVFTIVSLSKALSGEATCGCLGSRLPVNPWYMASFDFVAALSLLFWRPRSLGWPMSGFAFLASHELRSLSHRSMVAVAAVWLLLGLPAAFAMGSYTDTTLSDAGNIIGSDEIVVLEPGQWVGTPFPLLEHIDIGKSLSKGRWKVVLYHHDCPKCQAVVTSYESAISAEEGKPTSRVALVAMPPWPEPSTRQSMLDRIIHGRLSKEKRWFVTIPTEIDILDGRVIHVSR